MILIWKRASHADGKMFPILTKVLSKGITYQIGNTGANDWPQFVAADKDNFVRCHRLCDTAEDELANDQP